MLTVFRRRCWKEEGEKKNAPPGHLLYAVLFFFVFIYFYFLSLKYYKHILLVVGRAHKVDRRFVRPWLVLTIVFRFVVVCFVLKLARFRSSASWRGTLVSFSVSNFLLNFIAPAKCKWVYCSGKSKNWGTKRKQKQIIIIKRKMVKLLLFKCAPTEVTRRRDSVNVK